MDLLSLPGFSMERILALEMQLEPTSRFGSMAITHNQEEKARSCHTRGKMVCDSAQHTLSNPCTLLYLLEFTMQSYSDKNLVLTGFMGTGKTTVGKLLAEKLAREFIDTDALIEAEQKLSIPEIFKKMGEPGFRRLESMTAQRLGRRRGLVISTGGGLLLDPGNARELAGNSVLFSLAASPKTIMERMSSREQRQRPLLQVPNPQQQLVQLFTERETQYQQFITVSTDNKMPDQVASEILQIFQTQT